MFALLGKPGYQSETERLKQAVSARAEGGVVRFT
jgi:hypothetical protein